MTPVLSCLSWLDIDRLYNLCYEFALPNTRYEGMWMDVARALEDWCTLQGQTAHLLARIQEYRS